MESNKWHSLYLAEQMANIGSEAARLIKLKGAGEKEAMEKSLARALQLVDLTLSDSRWRGRLQEIARMREVLIDFCFGEGVFATSEAMLKNYFLPFALLSRANV